MDATIERKIEFITQSLIDLKESIEEYEKTKEAKQKKQFFTLSKRYCEEAVETTIKLNQILLKKHLKFPKSYVHSFLDLKEYYDFSDINIGEISQVAKFRNELAHDYIDMSPQYSIEHSKRTLKNLKIYLKKIISII